MKRALFSIIFLIVLLLFMGCSQENGNTDPENTSRGEYLIQLDELSPQKTGINFNNSFDDTGQTNVFIWHFIYNGAGVAIGDINGDDLPDIYFCGNRVPDRLFLNKGDFWFQDISREAGIQTGGWSTGVTMADVNADGLLDIYVCKNSPIGEPDRNRNKLFINKGGGRFEELSRQYGVDDPGFSIQATFFDADQDGDLDMYLLNQPFDVFARLVNPPHLVENYPETNRMFFFENGRYVDKTADLGMLDARYSLNVSLGDFDMNGWTDIYVCNDYYHADQLYLNEGGKFKDALKERMGHISFYSMGSDVGDINNDGWQDIIVLDMAFEDHYRAKTNMGSMDPERFWGLVAEGHHFQYPQNTLQLNVGHGYFSEVAQIPGIHKSDWSYAALFADLEHDGLQDILVTNGVVRDMQNNDFNAFVQTQYHGQVGPHNIREVMAKLPSNPVPNALFRNTGNLHFEKVSDTSGFNYKGFSHGLAYGDLDRDGKLDLAMNNLMSESVIYRNASKGPGNYLRVRLVGPGSNTNGLGHTVICYSGAGTQSGTMQTTRGYFSASEPLLDFGLGEAVVADSLKVFWNATSTTTLRNLQVNQEITISFEDSEHMSRTEIVDTGLHARRVDGLAHMHRETGFDDFADQVLLPYKLSQNGPFASKADLNADGREDIVIGGAGGFPTTVYFGQRGGDWRPSHQPTFEADREMEDQESVLVDVDNDGDTDLLVASGSNEFAEADPRGTVRLYLNNGKGVFQRAPAEAFPDLRINAQALARIDMDSDGDPDLVVGGRMIGGQYPEPASSILLMNENGRFRDVTDSHAPFFSRMGLVTDIAVADADADGDDDLLMVGEWMAPILALNNGSGTFTQQELEAPGAGLWWTASAADMDGDGDVDFLLGNLGWNNKFGGAKGTKLEVYAGDFDANGDFDVVLAQQKGDRVLPVRGRECSSQEMPFIWDKFPSFDSYGKAQLDEIIPGDLLSQATHRKLSTMSSVMLENLGSLKFEVRILPVDVQQGPVKAFETADLNGDGTMDFIYAGNHFSAEVETARYDGLYPGFCLGDGQGDFTCRTIFIDSHPLIGDFRDILPLSVQGASSTFLLTNNAGPAFVFTLEASKPEM